MNEPRFVAMLCLAGCGGPPEAPSPCPGAPPALSTCFEGAFFAECGGTDQPVLACSDVDYDCRWFAGGCVAAGYVPSSCAASEICCLDNWPFPAGEEAGPLYFDLYGWGRLPWDRDRAVSVAVVVDPALVPTGGRWTCQGDDLVPPPAQTPCSGWFSGAFYSSVAGTVTLELGNGETEGWYPVVEILPDVMRARVCAFWFTDAAATTCPPEKEPACAATGTLVLSALPVVSGGVVNGTLDVQFDGLRLIGSF